MAEEAAPEENECEECPKCPPVGAPAWMATFADMATLLMAFFVLILSFAEMNVPKFKTIQGSMKDAFGVQKIIPVVEQPKGTTILTVSFSPSPSPSVTKEVTSDTTETVEPELKIPTDSKDSEGSDQLQEGEGDEEGIGGENADGKGDDTAWKNSQSVGPFQRAWDKDPAKRKPLTATEAKLCWDRDNLYFFARMEDGDLFAEKTEHDADLWFDDVFELFFKPSAGFSGYYEFEFNPRNAILDIYFPQRGFGDLPRLKKDFPFAKKSETAKFLKKHISQLKR